MKYSIVFASLLSAVAGGMAVAADKDISFKLPLPPVSEMEASIFEALSKGGRSLTVGNSEISRAAVERAAKRTIESICGVDDMIDVERYNGELGPNQTFVAAHEPATAQIRWNDNLHSIFAQGAGNVNGMRWCTGTMISKELFLTAGHCFDVQNNPFEWTTPKRVTASGNIVSVPPKELVLHMHLSFNFQIDASSGNERPGEKFPIKELAEHRLGSLDYAIVKVGQNAAGEFAGEKFGFKKTSTAAVVDGTLLTVVQHPAGRPKKIEAGKDSKSTVDDLTYGDIDTLGGSSGAGVLNPAGEIIGVHTNGGCGPISGSNRAEPMLKIEAVSSIIN